ncbi:MAG: BrnT family toxin [Elusimicrobia bacterium]|nr:BrnT family toxin [Candidatus Liberimonas magnetica]
MKIHEWDSDKNDKLQKERSISFEEIVFYIERGDVLDIIPNPNKKKYPNQKVYVINVDDYIYLVPFIESEDMVFLKTIIPSRKATRKYVKRGEL